MPSDFLPYGKHHIDENDIEAVAEVLRSGALTCGPKVEAFETAFSEYIGVKHAVVCANGTAALHLACIAAGLGPGDVAIVPSITFLATANAVLMTGADVVFADVSSSTGLMTGATFDDAVARVKKGNLKAVLPVHMNGQAGEIETIYKAAKGIEISVITDCCHALGAEYYSGGRPGDGQFEDMATYSLHPVKSIAMGEGGMVTTNDDKMANHMRALRGHAMEKQPEAWLNEDLAFDGANANPWYYEMQMLAYNYRASDIQCALGLSQLSKLSSFVDKRRAIANLYDIKLSSLGNKIRPIDRAGFTDSAWHLYPVLIDFEALGLSRAQVMHRLAEKGIGTQVHYVPVSRQPFYETRYGVQKLPGADTYYSKVLSLPIFPSMLETDVERVVDALASL